MQAAVQMTLVFVYGTLKKGQPNYFRMLDPANGKASFRGRASTVDKFPLVIAEKGNVPFLLNIPGQGHHIQGEVYSVDDQMLAFLDHFERTPDMYQRTLVKLKVEEWAADTGAVRSTGSTMEAFTYSTTAYKPEWVTLQSYENYDSYGDHGLVFTTHL
ncbi:gamma-glutamylaminecyclotransferase-like [Alosa sapidissima]|uniref:gamma-glutamylaminecyclotransferase-like n=1 Tax=Alosa sapidissima TaxID=34773 RepID=UPI001C099362|nr:gamma-glutamylaminecyclotransferase-like [Alosa sapidissima]XP_041936359.1 gamma-glutamylaminecyclotransferase-like [Alosa sapidissima]